MLWFVGRCDIIETENIEELLLGNWDYAWRFKAMLQSKHHVWRLFLLVYGFKSRLFLD